MPDRTDQISSAQLMTITIVMTALAASLVVMGYPMIALAVGPFGLEWLRRHGGQVRLAAWSLAIGTSAVVIADVFAHDGWASALPLGGIFACLGFLGWRRNRATTRRPPSVQPIGT